MNVHSRVTAARRERNAADDRQLAAEQDFCEYAARTYPRPNEQADGALERVRRAERDVAYWGGAIAALTGKLPIDEAYPFDKRIEPVHPHPEHAEFARRKAREGGEDA